jgi:hypothetical protein
LGDVPGPDLNGVIANDDCSAVTISVIATNNVGILPCNGAIEYVYQAIDACGNAMTCTQVVTVADTIDPTIVCPVLKDVVADPNCEGIISDVVPLAIVDDNCSSNLTVVQSPAAGTVVGVGTHTITVTVTDACGNDATCDVTLKVVDPCNSALGDYVWNDRNVNGVQDQGEPAIDGVVVRLYDGTGTSLLKTTVTENGGRYMFNDLCAGDYVVEFVKPANLQFTLSETGPDVADSDAASNGRTRKITLGCSEVNPDIDAGLFEGGDIEITKTPDPELIIGIERPFGSGNFVSTNSVTFTFVVTNPKDVGIANVIVVDNKCGPISLISGDDNNNAILESTEAWVYECTQSGYTFSRGMNITNRACVTGVDLAGTPVMACADAEVLTVGINVEKIASGPVCAGGEVDFTLITRMINGSPDVRFRRVRVVDTLCTNLVFDASSDFNGNGFLDYGEEFTNTCSLVVTDTVTNVAMDFADVFYRGVMVGVVSNMDTAVATVFDTPSISVTATPASQSVVELDPARFTVTVVNTGPVAVNNINVVHSDLPACNVTIASLAPGESRDEVCVVPSVPAAGIVNQIAVTGASPDGCTTAANAEVEILSTPRELALIAGSVFFDENCDNLLDNVPAEFGFTNITINLFRNNLAFLTTQTDDDGDYSFPNLPVGVYNVQIDLGTVGSPYFLSGAYNVTTNVTINDFDDEFIDVDFGLHVGTIAGTVWKDNDSNGAINENISNPQIAFNGVTVELLNGGGAVVDTTTTRMRPGSTELGYYEFTSVVEGVYTVRVADAEVRAALAASGNSQDFRATTIAPAVAIDGFNCDAFVNFGFIASPVAIELASLSAANGPDGVIVSWSTGSETDNFGFNVYRSSRINGLRTRVNAGTIEALNLSIGGDYSFVDTAAPAGKCYYWLEDIDFSMLATIHGPAVVVADERLEELGTAAVTRSGIVKVTDAVLADAGLNDYEKLAVLIDGTQVPVQVLAEGGVILYVPEGAERIGFAFAANPLRMEQVDLRADR